MGNNPAFANDTIKAIRRLDRVLKHHDATLRRLLGSSVALEKEAFSLLEKRMRRLQGYVLSAEADRMALREGLFRLGVNIEQPDAAIGRSLRRLLGAERFILNRRSKKPNPAD